MSAIDPDCQPTPEPRASRSEGLATARISQAQVAGAGNPGTRQWLRPPDPWRLIALLFAGWALVASALLLPLPEPGELALDADSEEEAGLVLVATSVSRLPGWGEDRLLDFLPAFLRSCARLGRARPDAAVGPPELRLTAGDWQPVCTAAAALADADDERRLRELFERELHAFGLFYGRRWLGLLTGYYEPLLRGSRTRREPYTVPLYTRPPELVSVDLGLFRADLRGRRLGGRLEGRRLVPFASRQEIVDGSLAGRGLELVWVDSAVDAFFLQVQGSGRVVLERSGGGREVMRVGYAGQNGHPYTAIGRELVERGAMSLEEVSMQSIRGWLAENPDEATSVMARNASYVFFRQLDGEGPLGSEGVVLTPGRSMAVDRRYLPLGAPLWIAGHAPSGSGDEDRPLRRLMMAQDTGGAIRGALRGDVFWGAGSEAAEVAGRMRHHGRLWLLLPRRVAALRPWEEVNSAAPSPS